MLRAEYKTGLVFFPAFDWAISPTHPEREERLLYTQDQVSEEGLLDIDGIFEFKAERVQLEDVQRVHFCVPDVRQVMTESHFISAGGAKRIGRAVMEKEVQKIAKEERRTISELLREAFRQYLANRDLVAVRKEGRKIAKKMKLKPEDVEKIVREGRK